jgi:ribonuclease-3
MSLNEIIHRVLGSEYDREYFDFSSYKQAFCHKSVNSSESYERLEFLGDSVIGYIISEYLFQRFPNEKESFLTELKIKIVNCHMLSWLCQCIGLNQFLNIKKGEKIHIDSVYEDIFEAFFGCMFLDKGIVITRSFMLKIIENGDHCFIDWTDLIISDTNFKKQLLIAFQKNLDGRMPRFHCLETLFNRKNSRDMLNVVLCHPNGRIIGIGASKKLKYAQQSACEMAIKNGVIEELITENKINTNRVQVIMKKQNQPILNTNTENDVIPNVLINENNKPIDVDLILKIWNRFGVYPNKDSIRTEIYQPAFIHKSYLHANDPLFPNKSNERLNFFGNSVISYHMSNYLYKKHSTKDEGFLTKIKTHELKGANLKKCCDIIDIIDYLVISKNEEHNRQNSRLSEELFCALIASMNLDQGETMVEQWLVNMWNSENPMDQISDENYKHQLLLMIQNHPEFKMRKNSYPTYELISNETNYDKKIFTIHVYDPNGKIIGKGTGSTKKSAEQNASKNAIERFDDQS